MLHNAYIRDKGNDFEPIYVPNELYSFYINFDKPITDINFDNFRFNLMKDGVVISPNIGILKKYMVSSIAYNIYCEFIFPFVPNGGCYYFEIKDIVADEVKCKSNCIQVEDEFFANNSVLFHYRHKRPLYGFYYDNIPDFFNKFRLPLNKVDFQYETEKKQYRNVSDKQLRNLYTYRDKYVKIESYYFDELAHDAISVAYEHDDIIIDGTRYMVKDSYLNETNQLQSTTKGSVNAFEQERVFYPEYPDQTIYLLSPDGINLLSDGNDNLILT